MPGLPTALERIVEKAMTKDAAARYQSALDMANDLSARARRVERSVASDVGLAERDGRARDPPIAPDGGDQAKRRRELAGAGALVGSRSSCSACSLLARMRTSTVTRTPSVTTRRVPRPNASRGGRPTARAERAGGADGGLATARRSRGDQRADAAGERTERGGERCGGDSGEGDDAPTASRASTERACTAAATSKAAPTDRPTRATVPAPNVHAAADEVRAADRR